MMIYATEPTELCNIYLYLIGQELWYFAVTKYEIEVNKKEMLIPRFLAKLFATRYPCTNQRKCKYQANKKANNDKSKKDEY